jgi:tetratricopeptide (TPR) repeat protein
MKKLLKNLLSAILFVGILASCETTDPLIDEAQKNIFTQRYDSALAVLDRSIEKNPESGLPYYYKSLAYAEKAKTITPASERKDTYTNFRESIVTAREKFASMEEAPSEKSDVTNLVLNTWGFEHNQAIEYVNNDSLAATVDEPIKTSIAHLENAVIINPDSTLSWDILAQVRGIDADYSGAVTALEKAMSLKSPAPAEDYQRLGSYYNAADRPDEAISVLNEGVEAYPDSIQLVTVLADAYMQSGQREKSMQTLEDLIQRDPENARFHFALGTQLLQAATEVTDEIDANFDEIYDLNDRLRSNQGNSTAINASIDSLISENEELYQNMNSFSDKAEESLSTVTELDPDNAQAYEYLGISYQNKASVLYQRRNYTQDNDLATQLNDQAKEIIQKAMVTYEKSAELDPDNQRVWQSLYRVYLQLDMQEKAEEAMNKAGM